MMASLLPMRRVGASSLQVTPIGLGCWQFSRRRGLAGKFWPALGRQEVREIVKEAIAGGINWFDTAEVYGWGQSERDLADALMALEVPSDQVVVATKWWPALRRASSIPRTIGERQASLSPYFIDLYQVHQPLSISSVEAQMQAMARLVEEGHIGAVGVSNFSADRMRTAHAALAKAGIPLASNQVKYNLLDRRIERNGVLSTAKELGITIIAYSPLEQGILTGKFHDDPGLIRSRPGFRKYLSSFQEKRLNHTRPVIEALREIGKRHGKTPAQVALNWLVQVHGDRVVAVAGATKPRHAAESADAMSFQLAAKEIEQLSSLTTHR